MFEHLKAEESRTPDARELRTADTREPRTEDRGGESGQVTILVVFGALAFVLLIAFVYNTAKQTSRKIEMQGAADSAAVATGVWMARGMNLTALNNNTMVEMLSIMITVRAILQTEEILQSALTELTVVPFVGEEAAAELGCVEFALSIWEGIDETLNSPGGVGWDVLTGLDSFNQGIKQSFPYLLEYEATNYANLNGADQWPYAWVFPGKSGGLPVFPLARGPRNLLVTKAKECALRMFGPLRWMATAATFCGPISIFLGAMFINVRIDRNIQSLLGHNVFYDGFITGWGDIVKEILEEVLHVDLGPFGDVFGFLGNLAGSIPVLLTPNLRWEADVRPMLLTDEPDAELTENESPNLVKVHEYLQLLAVALGKSKRASPIGGEKFANPDLLPRITYAQADVYNPTRWDMFTQDWRAKLTRARLLDVKCRELGQKIGVGSLCGQGWSFVNTH